jgi:hypothetical protein
MNQPQYGRAPMAPPQHVKYAHGLGRGMLTFHQVEELVKAINPAYVEAKQNKAYLAQHQARAEMNRIFGYGNWDIIEEDPVFLYQRTQKGTGNNANKDYWIVGYRMRVTINVRDLWGMPIATLSGTHAEENAPLPNIGEAHAMALTSVSSYALRRALINLGDRFGLGLYNGGSKAPHGQYTAQLEPGQLFQWQPLGQQQDQQQAPPPAQPNHQTIAAEPAAPETYGLEEPPVAAPPRPPVGERMGGALAQVQAGNEAARERGISPEMAARIQQGMKVDGGQAAPMQGDVNGTGQQYAQDNS